MHEERVLGISRECSSLILDLKVVYCIEICKDAEVMHTEYLRNKKDAD